MVRHSLPRLAGATVKDHDVVLLVGLSRSLSDLRMDQFEKFSLSPGPVTIQSLDALGDDASMESMTPPAVVVLALSENAPEQLNTMRQIWPHAAVIISAPEARLSDVYPLIARGAADFVSATASKDELQAKCLLRLGAFRSRVHESSRSLGRLTINLMQRTVTNGSETASLTPIEIKIVTTLADSLGGVVQRSAMKQQCWGDTEITDNALNRKIYEVRRTLRRLSEDVNIRTIYGLGFELSVRPDAA